MGYLTRNADDHATEFTGITRNKRACGKNCVMDPPTYIFLYEGQIFSSFHALASICFFVIH
jgi:hypothetical protein